MGRDAIETDVFVVGGGPAGLAAAIAARQEGFRVSVADSGTPPLDKSCGEGLMPQGVTILRKLGVTLGLNDGVPFRGVRFVERRVGVHADFPDGWGRGVRRTTLHRLLLERARRAGVETFWSTRVSCGQSGTVYAKGGEVRARWIIGADGHNSRVRNWAGLGAEVESRRYGFRKHYRVAPWSEHVEVHWGRECQVYVTPTGARDICVAVLTSNPRLRVNDALPEFPEVAKRIAGAEVTSTEMGGVCASRSLGRVSKGSMALIGDASGTVDAITGDGLTLAMQQSLSLASALRQNDLRFYEKAHRRIAQRPKLMSKLLLLLTEHGWLRRRLFSAFSSNPAMFARLLAAHAGTMGLANLIFDYAPEFTWHVLTAREVPSTGEFSGQRFDAQ